MNNNLPKAPKMIDREGKIGNKILGIHVGGHDSSVAVIEAGEVKEVIEFERVFREKRYRIFPDSSRLDKALAWVFETYGLKTDFDAVAMHIGHFRDNYLELTISKLQKYLPNAQYLRLNHHLCHAAASYFTSQYTDACILSYDGSGNDGSTVTFQAHGNSIQYEKVWPVRMGTSYRALGQIIGGIHEQDNHTAGKTMGLTAYGKVIDSWKKPIKNFIRTYYPIRDQIASWEPSVADGVFVLDEFGPIIGYNTFGGPENLRGQDFATTFQECWTEIVLEIIKNTVIQTGKTNVCIVGGSALNAITNYYVLKMPEVESAHFIPNPNDAGLAMGAALYYYYAYQGVEWNGLKDRYLNPYLGLPISDKHELDKLATSRKASRIIDPVSEIAQLLSDGKFIGVINGRSEIGPRALGNRSIICDPRNPSARDLLNSKVKFREWYRPFAPIVREEDLTTYFDISTPTPFMSVIAYVKPEWRSKLPGITHVDGSARLQTITREQNEFVWLLLEQYKKMTGVGVLLNTSLNGKGEPIIGSLSDALKLLDSTALDAIFSGCWLFTRGE